MENHIHFRIIGKIKSYSLYDKIVICVCTLGRDNNLCVKKFVNYKSENNKHKNNFKMN